MAVKHDIVEKSGAWYSFGSDRLGQGREAAKRFIEENDDIYQTIESAVRETLGMNKTDAGDKRPEEEKEK